ncbi:Endonuclease/exonuclease/phosphatase [Cubamyces menziesii]|nr:Endonuclease/exonuclease/phosphatase [Cubamyces menziesii]
MRFGGHGGHAGPPTATCSDDLAPEHGSGPPPFPADMACGAANVSFPPLQTGAAPRINRGKTSLRVATLNMRGAGGVTAGGIGEKWMRINQLLRERKIAILALQETHLDAVGAEAVLRLFGDYLDVLFSAYPENETGACGVAFVMNKRLLKDAAYSAEELSPGRAILLTVNWPADQPLRLVNAYGPNGSSENAALWDNLSRRPEWTRAPVDALLGDFNVVEDALDRLPARLDPANARASLGALLGQASLRDLWREQHPTTKSYTYLHASTGSQSRLDRIYVRLHAMREFDDWDLVEPGLPTDHLLVMASLYDQKAPFVGKGRWAMPKHLLSDAALVDDMKRLAKAMIDALDALGDRTNARNPQTVYLAFKRDLISAIPRMQRRIDALRADLQRTLAACPDPTDNQPAPDGLMLHAAVLQDRLAALERKRFEGARRAVAARQRLFSETMTKQWARSAGTTTIGTTSHAEDPAQPAKVGLGR